MLNPLFFKALEGIKLNLFLKELSEVLLQQKALLVLLKNERKIASDLVAIALLEEAILDTSISVIRLQKQISFLKMRCYNAARKRRLLEKKISSLVVKQEILTTALNKTSDEFN